jgi:ankyrin repeat protein
MIKRIVIAAVFVVLLAASAFAQTADLSDLVKTGTPQDVQTAINNGADVNVKNTWGFTPLLYASQYNENPEVFTVLLKAGANLEDRTPYGRNALMVAVVYEEPASVIMVLLNAGANAKAKDLFGKTALDYAKDNEKLKGTDALKKLEEASK